MEFCETICCRWRNKDIFDDGFEVDTMSQPELPLKGNYNPDNFKLYFRDTGLLIGSLDEEVQEDLRNNKNFNTYKGAIYENVVADMLVKQGDSLYYYKNAVKAFENELP